MAASGRRTFRASVAAIAALGSVAVGCSDGGGDPTFNTPRFPGQIERVAGDSQTAKWGAPVAEAPSVRVRDQWGNPYFGAVVTFSIFSGGGSISDTVVVTDQEGMASVGSWRLGSSSGKNELRATAGDVSTLFTATAVDPCQYVQPIAFAATVDDSLTTTDCKVADLTYWDLFRVPGVLAPAIRVTMTSSAFTPHLELSSFARELIEATVNAPDTGSVAVIKLVGQSGDYMVAATSRPGNGLVTGAYRITTSATSADLAGCQDAFVAYGATLNQIIQQTDCNDIDDPFDSVFVSDYWDRILVAANPGTAISLTMTSVEFPPILKLYGPTGQLVAADTGTTGVAASLSFTPSDYGTYQIRAVARGATGGYTLTLQ